MPSSFVYDVCLSCSSKDITTVRPIAERLRKAGLQVWFDEGGRKSREGIAARIEQGLEQSRVLVLCISANAMGPEWPHLEAGSLRFRDPLNKERRFIPLRLDDAPLQGTAAQLVCLPWRGEQGEPQYGKLLDACGSPPKEGDRGKEFDAADEVLEKVIQLDCQGVSINAYFFSADRRRVLTGSDDKMVRLWDAESGSCLAALEGHTAEIWSVAWSPDRLHVLTGSSDGTVRLWNLEEGICVRILEGHRDWVYCVAWSPDGRRALSASRDNDIRLWDVATGQPLRVLEGHKGTSWVVAWSPDGSRALSGSADHTARLWDVETGRCLRVFEGHTDYVLSVAWSADQRQALTAAHDNTIRLWELETGKCLRVLEAHTNVVRSVAWGPDQRRALSGGRDNTVRLWDVASGRCLSVLAGHTNNVVAVAWSADGSGALSGDTKGEMRAWDLTPWGPEPSTSRAEPAGLALGPDQVQYTNAKVLLVGESGAGKTGLSKRLASGSWEPSESTIGAWATQWKLPVSPGHGVEREIWLWDFGGQADQRLIHQLYMDETALAILVFDGQKEDLLEMLGQWDRDLTRASRQEYAKLLVAGRVDAGGLRVSRSDVEKFAAERKFAGFLETSARTNQGCEELKQAVLNAIKWDEIPCRTTQVLFKRLKEEIIRLKDEGHVLMRFNELRERLHLRLSGELKPFRDDELRTVLKLLAGPCVVWELAFGGWVLLQPERINAYAQAVIRTLQTDQQQRGCLLEERVLHGDLAYEASMPRLGGDEERFVLLAMHQMLVERGLCLRQPTSQGNLLIFPSYYRCERPEQVKFPAVLVNYRFTGFLDEIYATLVVRLHHSEAFQQDQLWRYAADFKTHTDKQLGIKLTRRAPGVGDLEVYFDAGVSVEEKIIFSKYVHEHLLQQAKEVVRLRHYICNHCGTPVGNRDVAMKRLAAWLQQQPAKVEGAGWRLLRRTKEEMPTIVCVECMKQVSLWDELEQCFASPEIQQRVRDMQAESAIVLDNESKERVLVGEVISTVALAGQISREKNVSDHGIDMEIEFKNDQSEATGEMLFLQLKSGDSYLRERKQDGAELFTIKDERHERYWMNQKFPVLLVVRSSDGEVRWMEVRDYLRRESDQGQKRVKQIRFAGERFDVMSVRRWRQKALGLSRP